MTKGAIYYTSNHLNPKIMLACQKQLREVFDGEIVACSLEPIDFGDKRIVLPLKMGYLTMFKQILAALEASSADVVFMTEHDVLYPSEHFNFMPTDNKKFYYDLNWWKIGRGDLAVHWDAVQVSGLVAHRQLLIDFYRQRVETFDENNFDRKFEPTVNTEYETWRAEVPHIDIRHQSNTTYNKWKLEHFRKKETAINFQESTVSQIPGWSDLQKLIE